MKKKTVLFLLFVFALSIIFMPTGEVLASSIQEVGEEQTTQILDEHNIIEGIKELKLKGDEELLLLGMTKEEIKELREYDLLKEIDKELKRRSKLDSETLINMGYNEEEIKQLKTGYIKDGKVFEYDSNDGIETFLIGISSVHDDGGGGFVGGTDTGTFLGSTLTLTTRRVFRNDGTAIIEYFWSWNRLPVTGDRGIIGIAWQGSCPKGYVLTPEINESQSYNRMTYRGNTRTYTETKPFTVLNLESNVRVRFDYHTWINGQSAWAREGSGRIRIDRTGTERLNRLNLRISYGHVHLAVGQPTFTVGSPPGLSMTFSYNTTNVASVRSTIY